MSDDDATLPFLPDAPRLPDTGGPAALTSDTPRLPEPAPSEPEDASDVDLPRLPERPQVVPRAAPEPAPSNSEEGGPAYGTLPTGTDEGRDRARQIRVEANRRRAQRKRKNRLIGLAVLVVIGASVAAVIVLTGGGESEPSDSVPSPTDGAAVSGEADADGDVAAPGALGAIDAAREVVPQVGSVRSFDGLLGADVLAHTDTLPSEGDRERYVVRAADLAAANPAALAALVDELLVLPQVPAGDARLTLAPTVAGADIGLAVLRVDDAVIELVAVSADPVIRTAYP